MIEQDAGGKGRPHPDENIPARDQKVKGACQSEEQKTRAKPRGAAAQPEENARCETTGQIFRPAHRARTRAIGSSLRHSENNTAKTPLHRRKGERVQAFVRGNTREQKHQKKQYVRQNIARQKELLVRKERPTDENGRRKRKGAEKSEHARAARGKRFIANGKIARTEGFALPFKAGEPLKAEPLTPLGTALPRRRTRSHARYALKRSVER